MKPAKAFLFLYFNIVGLCLIVLGVHLDKAFLIGVGAGLSGGIVGRLCGKVKDD
jgi:hypothetical protein